MIAIDPLNYRLEKAKAVNKVETINPHEVDAVEAIRAMTGGRGADVCVDAAVSGINRRHPEYRSNQPR